LVEAAKAEDASARRAKTRADTMAAVCSRIRSKESRGVETRRGEGEQRRERRVDGGRVEEERKRM